MRCSRKLRASRRADRRGNVTVLMALLLIPLLAFTAYCVDVGWITLAKSELQNAADSAAAAGAAQLNSNYAAYHLPTQPQQSSLINEAQELASDFARTYAGYNTAGNVQLSEMPASDIQSGFTTAQGQFQVGSGSYPNTVRVTARRDETANSPLDLFLGPVLGTRHSSLNTTASATVYTGLISSFNPSGGGQEGSSGSWSGGGSDDSDGSGGSGGGGDTTFDCLLLPVAFDVNTWNRFFVTGQSADGSIYTDGNGAALLEIYPSPRNAPGNFGMLCIGPWTNSNTQYSDWVLNGPTSDDLEALIAAGSFPVSQSSPKPWKGSPGLRNALRSDFEAIIGQPRLLPLFEPASLSPYQAASGAGSNASYSIVGFVGVMVTEVFGNGANNLSIRVSPCVVVDPTAVFDPNSLYPMGAEPSTQLKAFTNTAPKLTQ